MPTRLQISSQNHDKIPGLMPSPPNESSNNRNNNNNNNNNNGLVSPLASSRLLALAKPKSAPDCGRNLKGKGSNLLLSPKVKTPSSSGSSFSNDELHTVCTSLRKRYLSLQHAFAAFDVNGDGDLELREFRHVLGKMMPNLKDQELDSVMSKLALDASGNIGFKEFVKSFSIPLMKIQNQRILTMYNLDNELKLMPVSQYEAENLLEEVEYLFMVFVNHLQAHFDSGEEAFSCFDEWNRIKRSPSLMEWTRSLKNMGIYLKESVSSLLYRRVAAEGGGFVNLDAFRSIYVIESTKPKKWKDTMSMICKALVDYHGSLGQAFRSMDLVKPNGRLNFNETVFGLRKVNQAAMLGLKKREIQRVFQFLDRDRNGLVTLGEWMTRLEPFLRRDTFKDSLIIADDDKDSDTDDHVLPDDPPPSRHVMDSFLPPAAGSLQDGRSLYVGVNMQSKDELVNALAGIMVREYGSIFQAFQSMDISGEGRVSTRELGFCFNELGLGITRGQLNIIVGMAPDTPEEAAESAQCHRKTPRRELTFPQFLQLFNSHRPSSTTSSTMMSPRFLHHNATLSTAREHFCSSFIANTENNEGVAILMTHGGRKIRKIHKRK